MNKANRKFKKMLERDGKALNLFLHEESAKHKLKAMEIATIRGLVEDSDEEKRFLDRKFNQFYNKYINKFEELSNIEDVLDTYNHMNAWFANFELLDSVIKKYEISLEEQADILAYFLNEVYLFVIREMTEKELSSLRKTIEKHVEEDSGYKTRFMKKTVEKRSMRRWFKERECDRKLFKHFRELIDENGEILPLWDAFELRDSLKSLNIDITEEQIDLILNVSLQKYNTKVAAEAKIEEETKKLESKRLAREKKILESFKNVSASDKATKEAKFLLRTYLQDDLPIKYLDVEEIDKVMELLGLCNYTPKQITDIKRRILENNKSLLILQEQSVWINAKNVLEENAKTFLEHVELVLKESWLPDILCEQLQISYDSLKEQLLVLYKANDFDAPYEMEIMLLFLDELAEKFDAFVGSKYSLVLKLNSN